MCLASIGLQKLKLNAARKQTVGPNFCLATESVMCVMKAWLCGSWGALLESSESGLVLWFVRHEIPPCMPSQYSCA